MDAQFEKLAKGWLKANRQTLHKYRGEWIAYNGQDGLIAHHKRVSVIVEEADKTEKKYIIKFLHPYTYGGLRRILAIRFRPLKKEMWEPNKTITLTSKRTTQVLEMLVDSGADISTVSLEVGHELGFKVYDDERLEIALGVNGSVEYVIREVQMEIDGHGFKAPVAWLQNEGCDDLLLGREVVFDEFDIEFKQAEEEIVFRKRNPKPAQ